MHGYNKNNVYINIAELSIHILLTFQNENSKYYNLNNINFYQCDLLNVKELNTKFDIILCSGVLHHLDNPIEGIFEDVKKFGGLLFGKKAIDIAINKVVTPEGIFRLYKMSTSRENKKNVNKNVVQ
mgnify:CR=1 FL=1